MSEQVSIITPMFNAAAHIEEALESVGRQSYKNWELLVVDDGSTDDSVARVKALARIEPRIKLIRSEINQGPAGARNLAISASCGNYLAFLDSDDYWHDDKLEHQIKFMSSGISLSFTAYQKVSEQGTPLGSPIPARQQVNYTQLLNSNSIPCLTAMYDVRKFGKQKMEAVGHEDYAYWLNLLKNGGIAHGLDEVLAYYRVRNGSVSNDKLKAAGFQWNIYRNIEGLSLPRSLYHFTMYTYKGMKKQRPLRGAKA